MSFQMNEILAPIANNFFLKKIYKLGCSSNASDMKSCQWFKRESWAGDSLSHIIIESVNAEIEILSG